MGRILVADDLQKKTADELKRSEIIRNQANRIASSLSLPVDLIHVEDPLSEYPTGTLRPKFLEKLYAHQKNLVEKRARLFPAGSRGSIIKGAPLPVMLDLIGKANRYDLVVVGTHGRRGLSRAILGSIAEEVIRNSKVPVMTVGPKSKDAQKAAGGLRILVPTDLGKNAGRAEKLAAHWAKKTGGEITLLHCLYEGYHPVVQAALASPSAAKELRELYQSARSSAEKKLTSRATALRKIGVQASGLLNDKTIFAYQAILKEIEKGKFDIVIMGTHGRGIFARAFFGTTAREVMLGSPVPVVTVRS